MNTLVRQIKKVFFLKDNLSTFYNHFHHSGLFPITSSTISIVMTSSNRSKQTLFTLKTISQSQNKDVQVILIDDSDKDPILFDSLLDFPFTIDLICIKREKKLWINPCINYNIGFSFIKGGYVIIQNAEVCHVGDVLSHFKSYIHENIYCVYDVHSLLSFSDNHILQSRENVSIDIYESNDLMFNSEWYQLKGTKEPNYHFLTGCTFSTFKKFNGFSWDYLFGFAFDDNDLLLRIEQAGIAFMSISYKDSLCGGIHQYHISAAIAWQENQSEPIESNHFLYLKKKTFYEKNKKYIELTQSLDEFPKSLYILNNS